MRCSNVFTQPQVMLIWKINEQREVKIPLTFPSTVRDWSLVMQIIFTPRGLGALSWKLKKKNYTVCAGHFLCIHFSMWFPQNQLLFLNNPIFICIRILFQHRMHSIRLVSVSQAWPVTPLSPPWTVVQRIEYSLCSISPQKCLVF